MHATPPFLQNHCLQYIIPYLLASICPHGPKPRKLEHLNAYLNATPPLFKTQRLLLIALYLLAPNCLHGSKPNDRSIYMRVCMAYHTFSKLTASYSSPLTCSYQSARMAFSPTTGAFACIFACHTTLSPISMPPTHRPLPVRIDLPAWPLAQRQEHLRVHICMPHHPFSKTIASNISSRTCSSRSARMAPKAATGAFTCVGLSHHCLLLIAPYLLVSICPHGPKSRDRSVHVCGPVSQICKII